MNKDQIKDYDFDNDTLQPKVVMEHLKAHDDRMDNDQPYMALAKAAYTTKFWRFVEGQENLNVQYEMSRLDQIEVNRIKPALTGYLANLYPRRMSVVIGQSPYTTGDTKKAEMLVNDWINQPVMRERILTVSRQALLYKGAGAKIGYDPAEEGLKRVWMRVFPYWEMIMDSDCHDLEDARFIGHVSFQPKKEVIDKYGLDEDTTGTSRYDYLDNYMSVTNRVNYDDEKANSDNTAFLRVLEFCNLVDDFYDTDGTRYKGRLEIYVLDSGYEGGIKPVFMGPLPLIDGKRKPLPHIVPLIFEHEPEYPYRGLAYVEQLLPQQKELNTMRSYLAQSARRDARMYVTPKGALDADAMVNLRSGEDGSIIEVDEQYAGNIGRVIVPIAHGPVSGNILNTMQMAEVDLERNTTISPAALGQVTKATASEVMALEGHTQSEYGRHAEQRDMFLVNVVRRCLAAHVASLYDVGDSEGAEQNLDEEGRELDDDQLESKRNEEGIDNDNDNSYGNNFDSDSGSGVQNEEESEEPEQIKEIDEDDSDIDPDDDEIIGLASQVEPVRKQVEGQRAEMKLVLLDSEGNLIEIEPQDIDSDFDIGFSEAGRSPIARAEMRNAILQLSDKMLQLIQVSGQKQGAVSVLAEEMYKSIHEQFEFPNNLSYDYIQNKLSEQADNVAPAPAPNPAAPEQEQPQQQPQEEPPTEQEPTDKKETVNEFIQQLASLPPDQALVALEEAFKDDPKVLDVIQKAKNMEPEQQAEIVAMILSGISGE
tara:strand:+ start:239 stop:2527 length:2289 start_codon:yes stop_codon:yes gene_type:complete